MKQLLKLSLALAMTLILMNCSETQTGSATSGAILKAWGDTLPTASQKDTARTKLEIGINRKVYFEVCAQFGQCSNT